MKPGWKTTEFWLSLAAMIVGALLASGALADGSTAAKVVGTIASVLGALGYTANRMMVKGKTAAAEAAKALASPPLKPSDQD
jgi:uncharacterized membrane protein YebE (DUF533 family)